MLDAEGQAQGPMISGQQNQTAAGSHFYNDSFHGLRELFDFSFRASSSFQTPSETEEREKKKEY